MRAILTFRLPQEQEEFDNATNGGERRWAMQELDQFLKGRESAKELAVRRQAVLVREELYRILNERRLVLFD
jgi:hypothetical protein